MWVWQNHMAFRENFPQFRKANAVECSSHTLYSALSDISAIRQTFLTLLLAVPLRTGLLSLHLSPVSHRPAQTARLSQADIQRTQNEMSRETNNSLDVAPEIMMHLCLTLTPRIPGYPTGPWGPAKPYQSQTQTAGLLLACTIQQKWPHMNQHHTPSLCLNPVWPVSVFKQSKLTVLRWAFCWLWRANALKHCWSAVIECGHYYGLMWFDVTIGYKEEQF